MNIYARLRPLLFCLEPESAHNLILLALKAGVLKGYSPFSAPQLNCQFAGIPLKNPLGMAAGFDKNGVTGNALTNLGFGFIEVGTITPRPQPGNPRPRLFRLPKDQALINRLGFNNQGSERAFKRLSSTRLTVPLGVNIGANKTSRDKINDYVRAIDTFSDIADYLTVNISSPNTPGLRDLQSGEALTVLLRAITDARIRNQDRLGKEIPIILKISPDIDHKTIKQITAAALKYRISGLVITNTTITRGALADSGCANQNGGLSGAPLFTMSTVLLAKFYRESAGELPLIGVGGIASGDDAWEKIRAGASALQLYTGLIYHGPGLPGRILTSLAAKLDEAGITRISSLIGTGCSEWAERTTL